MCLLFDFGVVLGNVSVQVPVSLSFTLHPDYTSGGLGSEKKDSNGTNTTGALRRVIRKDHNLGTELKTKSFLSCNENTHIRYDFDCRSTLTDVSTTRLCLRLTETSVSRVLYRVVEFG